MKTKKEISKEYGEYLLKCAAEDDDNKLIYPMHFIQNMKTHLGCISLLTPFLSKEDGLERRNSVIVVLGDSITAGHFEELQKFTEDTVISSYQDALKYFFIDSEAVYHEQLRKMLNEEYPLSPVSVLNAGIAGDTIEGMKKRVQRDVISHDPDLVILNGAMNFSKNHGDTLKYREHLEEIVELIRKNTRADIILVTPNMALPTEKDNTLSERVEIIRAIAAEEKIPLADVYEIWEKFMMKYQDVKISDLMANEKNHPTKLGHTVYALKIMNLLKDREETGNEF